MSRTDKTQPAHRRQAETPLDDARAYLQQAQISAELVDGSRRHATVASSAVLAGIAATDAACAAKLGEIAAGSHAQATKLLKRVTGSAQSVSALSRLLSIKSSSQYAGGSITSRDADDAMERAQRIVAFAEDCLR